MDGWLDNDWKEEGKMKYGQMDRRKEKSKRGRRKRERRKKRERERKKAH